MPNWSDDNGFSWYKKLECKRCLGIYDTDNEGEIPVHECLDGYYKSVTYLAKDGRVEYHVPKRVVKGKKN
jgi:hypothetical protein